MPKKWRNNWSACKTKELETKRDSTLLTLGNLTIITQSLNASIRDASWNTKLEGKKSQVGLKVLRSRTIYDDGCIITPELDRTGYLWSRGMALSKGHKSVEKRVRSKVPFSVSFHSKCKVLGNTLIRFSNLGNQVSPVFPDFLGDRIGRGTSLCRKSSVSTGWNKNGPCSNPVLLH